MKLSRLRPHVNPLAILTQHTFAGFGDARAVIVDIGAYKGEFVAEMCARMPDKNYVVFEVRRKAAETLRTRFARQKNIAVFDGDALRNFRTVLEPCQKDGAMIEEIYCNFPDPWPKERHKKRRVLTESFLRACQTWLDPRTTWILQTDHEGFFVDTEAVLMHMGVAYEYFDAPPHGVTTDWEDAKVRCGMPIYRMRFWLGGSPINKTSKDFCVEETVMDRVFGIAALCMLWVLHCIGRDDGH